MMTTQAWFHRHRHPWTCTQLAGCSSSLTGRLRQGIAFLALVLLSLLLAACGGQREPASAEELARHRAEVDDIERRLADINRLMQGMGQGAYRDGPTLTSDAQGRAGTVLERLQELQDALKKTMTEKEDLLGRLGQLRTQLATTQNRLAASEEDLALLRDVRRRAEVAREEATQLAIEHGRLRDELKVSEMHRLQIQRLLFEMTTDLLRLEPLQTQNLLDLQKRMRAAVNSLQVTENAAKDSEAKTAPPAKTTPAGAHP